MISVILYGRNDSYGYNLHKRGAISVNCLAALLSDPDDEILFVDCNTPDEVPTFIEAIYDTLTPRAKALLRVLRMRPELHRRMAGYTHLMVVEPPPRNIALRRSNPRNYWVLNTNTDILLVPRSGFRDLTEVVRDLPDGLYTLPRFELPEPLWESFPRADPDAILEACRELGPRLHLDEVTLSFPESRFDQVGDFQLSPRQALWDIHGFDERMVHGWHCDSNICRRLYLYYGGRTESLAGRLKGYHCDHTRVQTGMHQFDMKLDNNVQEFVFSVNDPFARHQADTWGAPSEPIEELDFINYPPARYVAAIERVLGTPQQSYYHADAIGVRDFLSVHAKHVLPYLVSDFTVYPRGARFAYAGNHAGLLSLASRSIAELGFKIPLAYAADLLKNGMPDGATPIDAACLPDELLANYDLILFDFSLDAEALNGTTAERVTDWPRDRRHSLGAVARCLEACAERAGAGGTRVPDFLVINANHHTFRNFVGQFLLLTDTPYATHVRKGRPRLGEERLYRSSEWKGTEDAMRSFFGYDSVDDAAPPVAMDQSVDFTSAGQPARFKDGHWGSTDYTGTWTDGERALFLFQPPQGAADVVVSLRVNGVFLGPEQDSLRVEVHLDGVPLAHWSFFSRHELVDAKVTLPAAMLAGKAVCRLEFHVENPQSVARVAELLGQQVIGDDPRMWGIRVQRIAFYGKERLGYNAGETLLFTAGGTGSAHTDECWSFPDDFGMWTLGPSSSLTLLPAEPIENRVEAIFTINDVAVSDEHPSQTVRVLLNGQQVADWTLGPVRDAGKIHVLLPPHAFSIRDHVTITFRISTPRTPVELGWSTWDTRPLGFRLARLQIAPVGRSRYRLGDAIDFVEGGDSAVFVGDSITEWSLPGSRGSWTVGNQASFRVPLEEPASGDLPCAFVISDCMVSSRSGKLPVTVKANGQQVTRWILDNRQPHRQFATIPAAVSAASPELIMTFEIAAPRSPQSLGWSDDSRPLGFQLARVAIGKREVDIPKFKASGRERPLYQRILGLPQYAVHVARILAERYLP